jgi:pilus assembly protein Flp/PilA
VIIIQIRKKGENTMLFAPKEKGQGLVEYALILVLIAVVVIVILRALGTRVNGIFGSISTGLNP